MLGKKNTVNSSSYPGLQTSFTIANSGNTVTGSATANQKGNWTTLISSTNRASYGIFVHAHNTGANSTATSALLDIGIGPVGGEQVLIPDLGVGYKSIETVSGGPETWFFPLFIPASSRLCARVAGIQASKNVSVKISLLQGGNPFGWVGSRVDTYGVQSTLSRGLTVNPGNNVYGTPTEFTSSIPYPYRFVQFSAQGAGATSFSASWYMLYRLEVDGTPVISNLPGSFNSSVESISINAGNAILRQNFIKIGEQSSVAVSAMVNGSTSNVLDFLIHLVV